ncbi:MAG: PepSY domain-containing protein [Proteobacteria bacterium]|jgi:hypothetical protein|nr:PepSY domain-containing protein [Pseudomonadota bacterium]
MKVHAFRIAAALAPAALALAALPLAAFASTYDGECTNQPQSRWMSTSDVKARFESQGYEVRKVKTGGSCYEVYAKDKDGGKVELFVNPVDASVVGKAAK